MVDYIVVFTDIIYHLNFPHTRSFSLLTGYGLSRGSGGLYVAADKSSMGKSHSVICPS